MNVLEAACERLRKEIVNGTGSMTEQKDELDRTEQWLMEVECECVRSLCVRSEHPRPPCLVLPSAERVHFPGANERV